MNIEDEDQTAPEWLVAARLRKSIPTDTEILDWLADERIFDGICGVDIDDAAFSAFGGAPYDEEAWKAEWRKQFRLAIMKGMQDGS